MQSKFNQVKLTTRNYFRVVGAVLTIKKLNKGKKNQQNKIVIEKLEE